MFGALRTSGGKNPAGSRSIEGSLLLAHSEREHLLGCRGSATEDSGEGAAAGLLGEDVDPQVLTGKLLWGLDGQAGGELLAGEGTARDRHRLDASGPADMTAEVVLSVDDRVVTLEDGPGVQANADARVAGQSELLPIQVLEVAQQLQGEISRRAHIRHHHIQAIAPGVAEHRLF